MRARCFCKKVHIVNNPLLSHFFTGSQLCSSHTYRSARSRKSWLNDNILCSFPGTYTSFWRRFGSRPPNQRATANYNCDKSQSMTFARMLVETRVGPLLVLFTAGFNFARTPTLRNKPHMDNGQVCDLGLARDIESGCQELTEYVVTRWYRAPEIMLACAEYSKVRLAMVPA